MLIWGVYIYIYILIYIYYICIYIYTFICSSIALFASMIAASMIYRWTKAVRSCTCRGVGCMEVCCSHPLLCRWLVSHPFGALCACWRSAGGFWYLRVIALWNAIVGIVGISLVFSSRKNNEMWLFTSFHVNQYRQKESQQRVFWQMWIDSVASKAGKMTYCIYIYMCVCFI